MANITLDPALLQQSIAAGAAANVPANNPSQNSSAGIVPITSPPVATPTSTTSASQSLKLDLDPILLAQSNAYGADPVNQQAYNIANYKAANSVDAFATTVNNSFENFGRDLLIKGAQIGNTFGADNTNYIANLQKLNSAATQQSNTTAQNYPISSALGNAATTVAGAAPMMAASGGTSLLGNIGSNAAAAGISAGVAANPNQNPLAAAGIGSALGSTSGALGSILGGLVTKGANAISGVLSPEGQEAAQVFAQTGIKQPAIASVGPLAQHVFENTSDLPLAGTTAAATGLVTDTKSLVQNQLDNYKAAFNQQFGNDSLQAVVAAANPPTGAGNFAAQALLKDIGKDDSWTNIISQSGRIQNYAQQAAYDAARSDILQKANMVNAIPVDQVQQVVGDAIKSATNPTTGNPLFQYSPTTISLLNQVNDDLGSVANAGGTIKYSDLANVQNNLSGILNGMYGSGQATVTADTALVNSIKKGFDDVQLNTLYDNPQVYNQIRELQSNQFKQLQMNKSNQIANLINNTANPNDAAKQVFDQALVSKDVAGQLFNSLDDTGRNAVKFGFAQKLYGDMSQASTLPGDLKQSIATMTAPSLNKMLKTNQDFIHTFFTPDETNQIVGSIRAAHYLDNYASTFSKAPTGRIAASASKLGALAYGAAAHPLLAAPVGGGIMLFNRLMNSNAGPWLSAASKLSPNSPAYANLMSKIMSMAPQAAVPTATNAIMPQGAPVASQ